MTPENASALALRTSRRRTAGIAPEVSWAQEAQTPAPRFRPGLVSRPRLLRRLAAAGDVPIAMIVAPAGYGKTTLLAEWNARDPRAFAWVALEARDDDPSPLRAAIVAALREPGMREPPVELADSARGGQAVSPPHALVESIARRGPLVIVLDDAHVLAARGSMRLITALADRLPPGSMLALASRRPLPLPIGRLRANRVMVELGARELAMTRLEAAMLFDAVGLRLDGQQVDLLLERTQGWPAALYLAALAVLEQSSVADAIRGFGGAERFVADYIRDELLGDLTRAQLAFARRTSILERLTPALCDAVLEAGDSAAVLRELSDRLLVAPLDRRAAELTYHPLLAELLRAEVARGEPELEPVLHRRAADWHDRRGDTRSAIRHAVHARDAERAGRLLWSLAPAYAGRGRAAVIGRWLAPFGAPELAAHPPLALTAALVHLAEGRRDQAERWTDVVAQALEGIARGGELATAAVMLRGCIARHGVRQMAADAARARTAAPAGSAWLSVADLVAGVAHHLTGDREAAGALLEDAARRATEVPVVEAVSHAQLALLAVELDDWEGAGWRADQARAAAGGRGPATALVPAVGAFVAAQRGDVLTARRDAARAERLLASLTAFIPWYVAETEIWLARAKIRLSDAATARTLLARAARRQAQAPDAPVLWAWLHEGWERADAFAAGEIGEGPSLTCAELRVLRFLPSHLSFKEIGARLHVSANTVKTQALSVYRKLDVSCRSDAVSRARALGLIDA